MTASPGAPVPRVGEEPVLALDRLTVTFRLTDAVVRAVTDACLTLYPGQLLAVVGESGSGKTTLLRVLALLTRPSGGWVELDGEPVKAVRHRVPARTRRRIALLFQSPRAASDPRLTLRALIADALPATADRRLRVYELADRVELIGELLARRPHAVSDGQLQRACLARALAQEPDYLLCDEATTMLDASTQAHLVAVIRDHQERHGTGVLTVSHNPPLLRRWADRTVALPPTDPA